MSLGQKKTSVLHYFTSLSFAVFSQVQQVIVNTWLWRKYLTALKALQSGAWPWVKGHSENSVQVWAAEQLLDSRRSHHGKWTCELPECSTLCCMDCGKVWGVLHHSALLHRTAFVYCKQLECHLFPSCEKVWLRGSGHETRRSRLIIWILLMSSVTSVVQKS